jgi:hypothetical protein
MAAATDKMFFASTLAAAAMCDLEVFRSWRNRNGLFPETQGGGRWNKFSIVDIIVAAIVTDLTKRGVMAQAAIDAAMTASPLLAEFCEVRLGEDEAGGDPGAIVSAILEKLSLRDGFAMLTINADFHPNSPNTKLSPVLKLHKYDEPLILAFDKNIKSIVVINLVEIISHSLMMLMAVDAEFERDGIKITNDGLISKYLEREAAKRRKDSPKNGRKPKAQSRNRK